MPDPIATPSPAPQALPRWHGDALAGRSARFAITLMAPIVAALVFGAGVWVAYAVLASILAFMMDGGGRWLPRLAVMAVAGLVVLAGGALGTLVAGDTVRVTLLLTATGVLYGVLESSDAAAASAARFFTLAASIGALFAPMQPVDPPLAAAFVLFAWLVSAGWDIATGTRRPSKLPKFHDEVAYLAATRAERWAFAAICGGAIAAAFLVCKAVGVERPNWAVLAIVVAVRMDHGASRRMVRDLLIGTVAGVAAAVAYEAVFHSPEALMFGMAIAAILRWPAQQLHGALGLGAMAAFVIMLLQLVAHFSGLPSHAPVDRLIDVSLGCVFAVAASWLNERVQARLAKHRSASART